MDLKLVLSVEALAPHLTGIGRYTWELAQRLPLQAQVQDVRFYRGGRWIDEPASLLQAPAAPGAVKAKKPFFKLNPPRWLRDWQTSAACHGRVFLLTYAQAGVAMVNAFSDSNTSRRNLSSASIISSATSSSQP